LTFVRAVNTFGHCRLFEATSEPLPGTGCGFVIGVKLDRVYVATAQFPVLFSTGKTPSVNRFFSIHPKQDCPLPFRVEFVEWVRVSRSAECVESVYFVQSPFRMFGLFGLSLFRVCNLSLFRVSKVLDFEGCRDKIVSGGHGVKGSNGRDAGRPSPIF
jgi:hypothetical protein